MLKKIRDWLHWPVMVADLPPAPLAPLPIIIVLFEWVGIYLIGLLQKSTQSAKHLLVIIGYTMH